MYFDFDFDSGNWGVDLQAGSQFGYRLLFVVLLSGLFAVFLQVNIFCKLFFYGSF
jgi:metal iron transporter